MPKVGQVELDGLFGGIELVNKPASSLPQDLASAFAEVNGGLLGATYVPIWYVGTQVVNGINHFLICKEIRITKEQKTCIVALVINIPPNSIGGNGAKIVNIIEEADLPDEVEEGFEKATKDLLGVDYKPIMYVGKQIVHGTNYYVICQATAVYPGAQPNAVMFAFNVSENGVRIVSITPIMDTEEEGLCGCPLGEWP